MANVRVDSEQPGMPSVEAVGALVPVRSGTLRRMARGSVQVAEWKVKPCARLHCMYDTSSTPLLEQDPGGVDQTIRNYFTATPRVAHIWVRVRLQPGEDSGGGPSLTLSLVEDDDTEIDPGCTFDEADLVVLNDDPETYQAIEVYTAIRTTDTPGAATASRMLNVEDKQGARIAVKAETTNCRIWEIDAWQFVPAVVAQTFTT